MKKVVVITGASSGIGLVAGKYLVEKGYKVYGLSRTEINDNTIIHIPCDVTNQEQVRKAFAAIDENIYAVINNAGIGISGPFEYESRDEIMRIINVNIIGVVNICQLAIPYLRKTKGKIINIGSVAADFVIPFQLFYSLTKAALQTITEGLRLELKPFGISVTTILPGDTKTSFTANRIKNVIVDDVYGMRAINSIHKMEEDEKKGKDPISVARVIAKVLKRKNPPIKVTVGCSYKILIFLKRIFPLKFISYILYKMYGGNKSGSQS